LDESVSNTAPPALELRRAPRYEYEVPVKVHLANRGAVYGHSRDVSERGIAVHLPAGLEPGHSIQAEFPLPHCAQRLVLPGVVRYSIGSRCGVEFGELTDHERAQLERACRALAPVEA
jgi:hypothetical protein